MQDLGESFCYLYWKQFRFALVTIETLIAERFAACRPFSI